LNHNASAYRIELHDGNYELVPESEGEPAEGEVNMVEVQQNPNKSSEDLATDFASCHTCFSIENQVQTYMHARIKFHAYS
jgi:hypothetical protein